LPLHCCCCHRCRSTAAASAAAAAASLLLQVPILSWDGVLPANDPDVDLEVERLNGRQQGVIRVHVIQAKDLKSYDTLGA
jgi:hypothetical protein